MSTTIDQKVVEMQFDNRQFESGVSTTLSSLDKLKQGLNLNGASKGLENVGAAARRVDISPLGQAAETVAVKFSHMQATIQHQLDRLVSGAIDAGLRITKALTIQPVTTGFNEYELKMGSIQTIMASTGEDLDTVNRYLGELNEYSDKTIYSFSDMTQNIGKFTNAGVKLEDAVAAIKGVSNVAAVSGANSNEASRAMYNFAQALSAGYVKLVDWKSIELANMGTVEFKQQLIDAAVAAGTLTKTSDGMYETLEGNVISATKGFNESLQDQWMTTEVLVSTLKDYADETTEIGKKATKSAQDIKTFSMLFDTLKESAQSGWATTWELLVGDFEEAKTLLSSINEVVGGFLQKTADARNNLIKGWKDLGGRTVLIEALSNVFQALVNVVKPIKEAFQEIFPPITAKQLYNITEKFRDFTEKLKEGTKNLNALKTIFKAVFTTFKVAYNILSNVVRIIAAMIGGVITVAGAFGEWVSGVGKTISKMDLLSKCTDKLVGFIKAAAEKMRDFISSIKQKVSTSGIEKVLNFFKKIGQVISPVIDKIKEFAKIVGKKLSEVFNNFSLGGAIDVVNGGLFGALLLQMTQFVKGLSTSSKSIGDVFKGLKDLPKGIKDILDPLFGCFEQYQKKLQAETLITIAKAIAILAASLVILSFIDPKKLTSAIAAITMLFADLVGGMAIFNNKVGGDLKLAGVATSFVSMSVAILILSAALKMISGIESEDMVAGMAGIAAATAIIIGAAKLISSNTGAMIKGVGQIILMSVSVMLLATACKSLSKLGWEELAKGLVGVSVLMATVSVFLSNTKINGKFAGAAFGMILMATALKILANVCKDFGQMDWDQIGKGLTGIGGLLAELAIFTKLTSGAQNVFSTGLALVLIAASMKIFASAMQDFAQFNWDQIGRGLTAMAGSLIAVAAAMKLMPAGSFGSSVGLVIAATSLIILAQALNQMGGMSWDEVARGLTVLGGALVLLAAGLYVMSGTIAGAAALAVAAASIMLLAPALLLLGSMSWEAVGKGLAAIAGAFVVFGVAGLLLGPIAPIILMLSAGIALFGVGCLTASAGLFVFVAAMGAIAGAGAVMSAAFTAMLTAIISAIPLVVQALLTLVTSLLTSLANAAPQIIAAGVLLIVNLLTGLTSGITQIVEVAVQLIVTFVNAIADQLGIIIDAALNLVAEFIDGLAEGIRKNNDKIIDAVTNLAMAILETLVKVLAAGPELMLKIAKKLTDEGFIAGVKSKFGEIKSTGKEVLSKCVNAVKEGVSKFKSAGKDLINGFVEGIKSKMKAAGDAASSIGKKALNSIKSFLGIKSPSREMIKVGKFVDEGLIVGLDKYSGKVGKSALSVGKAALQNMRETLSSVADILSSGTTGQPTIRPIVDLSAVAAGAGTISSLFGETQAIGVNANLSAISSGMNRRNNRANEDVVSAINDLKKGISNMSGDTYHIGGISYDSDSAVADAIRTLVGAIKREGRS